MECDTQNGKQSVHNDVCVFIPYASALDESAYALSVHVKSMIIKLQTAYSQKQNSTVLSV